MMRMSRAVTVPAGMGVPLTDSPGVWCLRRARNEGVTINERCIYPDSAGTRKSPLRISSAAILVLP